MKKIIFHSKVIFLTSAIFVLGCKEELTVPVVVTVNVSAISSTTAMIGGAVTNEGGTGIIARGVCCSTSPDCSINDKSATCFKVGFGPFSAEIKEMSANTQYYARAWAKNSLGTGYGDPVSFTTEMSIPASLTTTEVITFDQTSATSGGNITNENGAPVILRGVCWDTLPLPTVDLATKTADGEGKGFYTSKISKLKPSTKYYVRAYATSLAGTGYGNEVIFTTRQVVIAAVTTNPITSISNSGAVSGGDVINDFGGPVTVRGVCWNTSTGPTISLSTKTTDGAGTGAYTSTLTQLTPNTTYYVRAYATNSEGTSYGNELVFTTAKEDVIPSTDIVDADGNSYDTVRIGNQVWMAENLRTTSYSDKTPIPPIPGYSDWIAATTPGYCWYNNEIVNKAEYGALYNWYVVDPASNGGKNVCPVGWHVPSEEDWTTLISVFGDELKAGEMLKEEGYAHWMSPNAGATNGSKFTALPGGTRNSYSGIFEQMGSYAYFWSASSIEWQAYSRELSSYYGTLLRRGKSKLDGCSIRCLRNP